MQSILASSRVLPVVTPIDPKTTVSLSRALLAGGMPTVEITMRSSAALDCIRAVKSEVPDVLVAAGTIVTPADLDGAMAAGADLFVSPGATPQLLAHAKEADASFLPGIASASELMLAMEYGYSLFKLFPAVAAGGIDLLKSLGGPFPSVQFCPTGGLNTANFRDYLALPNVVCCGGSWMTSPELVEAQAWQQIQNLAEEAMRE